MWQVADWHYAVRGGVSDAGKLDHVLTTTTCTGLVTAAASCLGRPPVSRAPEVVITLGPGGDGNEPPRLGHLASGHADSDNGVTAQCLYSRRICVTKSYPPSVDHGSGLLLTMRQLNQAMTCSDARPAGVFGVLSAGQRRRSARTTHYE